MTHAIPFAALGLCEAVQKAVASEGYTTPTPIQEQAIPHLLDGRDLLGCAQTGTGKTAAFALPILHLLADTHEKPHRIRALVLTPTRELAAQIDESFRVYGRHLPMKAGVIFGGVNQRNQEAVLKRGIDILVATPGRLLDLMKQKIINLKHLEIFVLDEADRMLDMGFIHDVRRVIADLPAKRQSLFFSATMPDDVAALADTLLTNPERVEVTPQSTPVERIAQSVMFVDKNDKRKLLETLMRDKSIKRALVFSRTKHGANRIAQHLKRNHVKADAIHGDKAQNARTRALDGFRSGSIRVLVATDIAARGIDVDGVTHVINFDLPNLPESYVHRIGRTARAGADGTAISFCSGDERIYLADIERTTKVQVSVTSDHAFHSEDAANGLVDGVPAVLPKKKRGGGRRKSASNATAPHSQQTSRDGSGGNGGRRRSSGQRVQNSKSNSSNTGGRTGRRRAPKKASRPS